MVRVLQYAPTEVTKMDKSLGDLRAELHKINHSILDLLCRRAELVTEVLSIKEKEGIPLYVPEREREMLDDLARHNRGPFSDDTVRHLFLEIFRASVSLMEQKKTETLRVSRDCHGADGVISVGRHRIGGEPVIIAGPCAVESAEQMEEVGRGLSRLGVRFLRGGAFKPRSSPYSFKGLGEPALKLLRETGERFGMATVTEVMDTRTVGLVSEYCDVLQIGARNMYNYELLREVGRTRKPVLLKRGISATIDEFLWAAEYVVSGGNEDVILCERGIRTFETQTRNTLDISAVPILRKASFLPVIVDVSHAAGRKDILAPLGRAAIAAGANGLMVEVHPFPAAARSDSRQQLDLHEFARFLNELSLERPAAPFAPETVFSRPAPARQLEG